MKTPPPPSTHHRSPEPAEQPADEETVAAHAKRALRAAARARITAVLDAGIAGLQGLRRRAGGPQDAEEDEDRPGSRIDRPRDRHAAAAPEAEAPAPRPRRRLRAFLIHVGMLLAGGAAGGALAYNVFQQQLGRQLKESRHLQEALEQKIRPTADIRRAFEAEQARRGAAEKKLAATFAEYAESTSDSYALLESLLGQQLAEGRRLEAALAENTKSGAEARTALADEQARRAAAEEKLAVTLAEYEKTTTEKQRQLDLAERRLARLAAADESRGIEPDVSTGGRAERRRSRPARTGDCTVEGNGVGAVKGCIADFNQ